ncbi:RNA-directed DNA polymerase [uncultured Sphingomonas sp.]|uniref:RNA-directed DNA polymerase n=1 Tax=uncultured Sphingomonas sp. TaxID=158754 RepID=UPI0025D78028|nr:RNA-directed DNA polymerase [uncultured Sphingomonas sp.]
MAQLADTDILPPLFEFKFFSDSEQEISCKLENLNFGTYAPKSCFEVLSPKTRLSFRIAHQLYAVDTLLYTSAVLDIAPQIEAMRLPSEDGPFSYRFVDNEADPQLYSSSGSYHDWLLHVQELCEKSNPFDSEKVVIETDISDFYPRIYFHRVEHILDDCGASNSVRKIIEGIIKFSRAHQSHGLPVGTAASRLLSEAVLNDTDRMIVGRGLKYARYVDDYRIIVDTHPEAHSTLCRIAEHLMLTEGLSLNAAKTKILGTDDEISQIEERLTDVFSSNELAQLNRYFQLVYDGEDVSAEDISGVDANDLLDKLTEILQRDSIDYASVKVILKALRAVDGVEAETVIEKYPELLYYTPRDFCILIGTLAQKAADRAAFVAERLVDIIQQAPFSDMALSRLWVGHLFVTQALPITDNLLQLQNLTLNVAEKRQNLLLRGLLNDRSFFREQKTKFHEVSDWEKPALMLAMSCLASSEYDKWIGIIRSQYNDILSDEYCKWLKSNSGSLFEKLKYNYIVSASELEPDDAAILDGNSEEDVAF